MSSPLRFDEAQGVRNGIDSNHECFLAGLKPHNLIMATCLRIAPERLVQTYHGILKGVVVRGNPRWDGEF